jgi:glycosyltransferase involved in cell wall biosynthesis
MKILAIVSTLDLKFRLGCTPAWWQLFKALHETGNEVVATPYLGAPVQSLWWRTYPNPCTRESTMFNAYLDWRKGKGQSPSGRNLLSPIFDSLIKHHIQPNWKKHIIDILEKEHGIGAVLIMNVPINHISSIPSEIKQRADIPVIYYDGDMPTSLPKYTVSRGFKFNYYENGNLSEYDGFLTNSQGCIPDLQELGARNVHALHYGIDPDLCSPVDCKKDIDVSFFGYGSDFREEWMEKLITIPSKQMTNVDFVVGGKGFNIDLGNAKLIGDLSYSEWRELCCRSKVNLNITRWSHTNIYGSSTSRPFELAAYGACIVSQPYNGIDEWFEPGKELIVVNDEKEAMQVYQRLLDNDDERETIGRAARDRVLSEHTFRHRAKELVEVIETLNQ